MALDRPDQEPKTQLVCYGTLFDIRAACPNGFALDKAQFKKIKKPDAPIKLFKIATSSSHVTIQSPDGNDTALLDLRSASCLRNLQERGATEFKGVIGRFPREPSNTSRNENISQDKSQLNVSVNVYGPIDFASRIGEYLLQEKHYLQHPDALESRITYHNPQCFRSPSITEVRNFTNHCIVDGLSDSSITADLSKIMDTLDVEEESEVISPIRIVVTPLLKFEAFLLHSLGIVHSL
ncbi:uncharacterized protein KY384_005093 [Bacidia gigantensis]|uniref:uncharacterized protein n=1 Tax=Bacidia gigantensis TaxID=2732470 RepID=UPI001D037299|nr:uncharacterized protein KY384_005093 [Bacidia gigantensis]KAG8530590.1 hypothetical protein KY384_005093 [Bacidia gigantensis]